MSRRLPGCLALALLLAGWVAAAARPSAFSYRRFKLWELVCCADAVVSGTITAVETSVEPGSKPRSRPGSFTFEIDSVVVGRDLPATIRVGCFQNWTCASRWKPYAVGQREVLFLYAPPKDAKEYVILGAGDEGEMPLEDGSVFAHGYPINGQQIPGQPIDEAPVRGSKVPLAEFAAAVTGFREQLSWTLDPRSTLPVDLRPAKDIEAVLSYGERSAMARQLVADVRSSEVWRGPVDPVPELVIPAGVRTRAAMEREFGSQLCVLGDVDGDGEVDLAVGDPYDDTIINQHGALRVLFLGKDGSVKGVHLVNEAVGSYPSRMNEFAHLGQGLAPIGDIDGDGVPDLVVSAPGCGGSWKGRGSVWILELKRDGSAREAIEIDGDAKLADLGVEIGSGLGESIVSLGDLDGDGFPELAIGENPELNRSEKHGRAVYLVSLGRNGVVRWATRIHDRADGLAEGFSHFGAALAAPGDVDGDGVADLAVSDCFCPDGGETRGAVWILCLRRDGTLKSNSKISDWSGNFAGRLHDESHFGSDLYALGDVDDDGIPDLAASTRDGLWVLSLDKFGSVRSCRVLPMEFRREAPTQRRFLSLLRVPAPQAKSRPRFVLYGWTATAGEMRRGTLWYLQFDEHGELGSW